MIVTMSRLNTLEQAISLLKLKTIKIFVSYLKNCNKNFFSSKMIFFTCFFTYINLLVKLQFVMPNKINGGQLKLIYTCKEAKQE